MKTSSDCWFVSGMRLIGKQHFIVDGLHQFALRTRKLVTRLFFRSPISRQLTSTLACVSPLPSSLSWVCCNKYNSCLSIQSPIKSLSEFLLVHSLSRVINWRNARRTETAPTFREAQAKMHQHNSTGKKVHKLTFYLLKTKLWLGFPSS